MKTYASGLPDFNHFMPGDAYPWRNFTYNHTKNFLAILIPKDQKTIRFHLYSVMDGCYCGALSEASPDAAIDSWISKCCNIVDVVSGFHIKVRTAAKLRSFAESYACLDALYDKIREPDVLLEEKAFGYSKAAKMLSEGSKSYELLMNRSEELLEEQHIAEENAEKLFDEIERIFNADWYMEPPMDELIQFGCYLERFDAILYGKLRDRTEDPVGMILHIAHQVRDLLSANDETLLEMYYLWNQPDEKTIGIIKQVLDIIKLLDTKTEE